jgi:hypothetical protein
VTPLAHAALALSLGGTIQVSAGDDLAAAIARAKPGDLLRLGPGIHRGGLGRPAGIAIEGAGAGVTVVIAPEGEDGLVAAADASLRGISLRAGPGRAALKVIGGAVRLDDVALAGGVFGAFVDGGSLVANDVALSGEYGLLVRAGRVALHGGSARGVGDGLAVTGGELSVHRFDVVGPSREAGIAVSRGTATLEAVTIRSPGPSGIGVSGGGTVVGTGVTVAGATESDGFMGGCVEVFHGKLRLSGATLVGCGGTAVEVSGGEVSLRGVDASGGSAGCFVFLASAIAELQGNVCGGHGPGLVLAGGARATAIANRWWTDPAMWVDCASGARATLGRGEVVREPCAATR